MIKPQRISRHFLAALLLAPLAALHAARDLLQDGCVHFHQMIHVAPNGVRVFDEDFQIHRAVLASVGLAWISTGINRPNTGGGTGRSFVWLDMPVTPRLSL